MTILKFDGRLVCAWGDRSMFLTIGGRDVFAAVRGAGVGRYWKRQG
jgi:hypothetical protein